MQQTDEFQAWLRGLRDKAGQVRILARLRQATLGNLGDHKAVGGGVSEMRINFGPGYRVYFKRQGTMIIVILAGGDKASQASDIERARKLVKDLEAT